MTKPDETNLDSEIRAGNSYSKTNLDPCTSHTADSVRCSLNWSFHWIDQTTNNYEGFMGKKME